MPTRKQSLSTPPHGGEADGGPSDPAATPFLPTTRIVKRRDASRTREAILKAARETFVLRGFEKVGVREITREAGFNPSLVNRYFGSKGRLFSEAVLNSDFASELDRSVMDRLCALMSTPLDAPARDREVLTAIVRSAASDEARTAIRDFLQRDAIERVSASLEVPDAEVRAAVIVALALGVQMTREVFGVASLVGADPERISRLFAATIAIIAGREPSPSRRGKRETASAKSKRSATNK